MTGINRGLLVPLATVIPVCAVGCKNSTGGAPKPLAARVQPYIVDVPIPKGFEYIPKRSTDWMSGPRRFVKHEYEGRANPITVRNFFREQMPPSGWKQLSDDNTRGDITITFEKQGETCTIEILPRTFLGFPKTILRVTISQIDRGAVGLAM